MSKEKIYLVLYELSDTITTLFLFNLFWIVVNSPLILLILQMTVVTQSSSYFILIPLTIFLFPLLFFPSTQALFCALRDFILQKSIFSVQSFWSYFVSEFKNSLKRGIILTGAMVIIGLGLVYSWTSQLVLFTVFILVFFYILLLTIQVFSFQAHFNMTTLWKFKRAHQLIFARPFYSIGSFLSILLVLYALFELNLILFILAGPATAGYVAFFLFNFQYKRITISSKSAEQTVKRNDFLEV